MKIKKIFVSAFLSLISISSIADTRQGFDVTVSHSVFTNHTSAETFQDEETGITRDWNEDNGFTGVRWEYDETFGFGLGFGENSYFNDSYILDVEAREQIGRFKGGDFEIGSNFILASGYEPDSSSGIMAGMNPFIRYRKDWGGAVKLGSLNFVTINVMLEYSF